MFPPYVRKPIMSQQPKPASLLARVCWSAYLSCGEHGTTVRTEAIAGFTTFLTMVCISFLLTHKFLA